MDLFSWIYEAPASRSSKSALCRTTILSSLRNRARYMATLAFLSNTVLPT